MIPLLPINESHHCDDRTEISAYIVVSVYLLVNLLVKIVVKSKSIASAVNGKVILFLIKLLLVLSVGLIDLFALFLVLLRLEFSSSSYRSISLLFLITELLLGVSNFFVFYFYVYKPVTIILVWNH